MGSDLSAASEEKLMQKIQALSNENDALRQELEQLKKQQLSPRFKGNALLKKFVELARLTNIGFWEYDVNKNSVIWSDESYKIFHYPIGSEINYQKVIDRVHPEDKEFHDENTQRWIEKANCTPFEYRIVLPKGEIRYVYANGSVTKDKHGKVIRMFGALQDVTGQKEVEHNLLEYQARLKENVRSRTKELEQNQQLLSTVTSEAPIVIFALDKDGIFTFSDGKGLAKLGLEPGQVVGLSAFDLYKDYDTIYSSLIKALSGEQVRIMNQVGDIYFDSMYRPLKDSNDKVIGLVGIAVDITEQRLALEDRQRYFETTLSMLCTASLDGYFIDLNPAWENTLGYSTQELKERKFLDFVHPDDLEATLAEIEHLAHGEKTINFTNRYITKTGEYRWLNWSAVSYGKMIYASAIDITEQVKSKLQLEDQTIELQRSNRELEQFAYVSSHDLQEPLRKIKNYSEMLDRKLQEKLDDDTRQYMNIISRGVDRMQKLINDLLAYSRVSSRGKPFEVVDLNKVLKEVRQILELQIYKSNAEINVQPLPTIIADDGQIIQLFQNLISNGIKFNKSEHPIIEIGVAREDKNSITLYVKDNGIGIEKIYQDKIFTIFQRLHTRDKYEGTGIGLAICQKIVERHRGAISLESSTNEGTTFFIELPNA